MSKCEHCGHRIPLTLGERIKHARLGRDLYRKQVEDVAQLSNGIMTQYEKGNVTPNTASLVKIANALEVSIDWLLTGRTSNGTQ